MTAVLIVSNDLVGPTMAGTGMRCWELAQVLSWHVPVTLAAPAGSTLPAPGAVQLAVYDWIESSMRPLVEAADVVVAAGESLVAFPFLMSCDRYLVVDGYDPHTLEGLIWNENAPPDVRLDSYRDRLRIMKMQCARADLVICASERQRMLWLGWLEAAGRINPATYDQDPTLRALVDVVPIGLPAEPPRPTRPMVRGVIPGIGPHDLVLVWGGGIWNWLDPLTLIRAVARAAESHPQVRLYFPGPRHPYQAHVPDMAMHGAALELSRELGLLERHVFWGEWVPYAERQNYLLEADIGCSLHLENVESYFAFRTRMLDYLWAGLPMIATRGDAMSELVERHDLGVVVDYQDVDGVAEAIGRLAARPRDSFAPQFARLQEQLRWERCAGPLVDFCRQPYHAPDRGLFAAGQESGVGIDELLRQQREIAHLREVIAGYENGRLMRLLNWVQTTRRRLGRIGRPGGEPDA